MRVLICLLLLGSPSLGLAAGDDGFTAPTPTETTTTCSGAKIWDERTRKCVDARDSSLSDQDRFQAVRELAYAGAYDRAKSVLATFASPAASGAQTYAGFLARKTGDMDAAFVHYRRALETNPDNLLVRSYMGQAFVEIGDTEAARAQLREIRARGGRQTWPEFALASAIRSGQGYAY
ncbi:tetratricopeptide repeat protein [Tropicimonas sp. S265A]|uniref:tetratricopeptide repeat protein n=1 Tax=Tropicimonas sp. S265A TaxID=3415134 RepID=UPI003C7C8B5D